MSGSGSGQPRRDSDGSGEVADPLLWGLALNVADAHAAADDGTCRQLHCAGQTWPCEAWHNAQRALTAARDGAAATRSPAPSSVDRPDQGPEQVRPRWGEPAGRSAAA